MNNEDLKERNFEADIEQWLITEGGYTKGDQRTYDKERVIDMATLTQFLALTQPKSWESPIPSSSPFCISKRRPSITVFTS